MDIAIESSLLPVSDMVTQLPESLQKDIYDYISQLDEYQKKAYLIAYNHLGSSFNIYKSNGFKEWKNKQN
jgi:hypothetical protein